MKVRNNILKFALIGTIGAYLLLFLVAQIGYWFDYGLSQYNETYSKFATILGGLLSACITIGFFAGIGVALFFDKKKLTMILMGIYFVYYCVSALFRIGDQFNNFIEFCGLSANNDGRFAGVAIAFLFEFFAAIFMAGTLTLLIFQKLFNKELKPYPLIVFLIGVGCFLVGGFTYWIYILSNNGAWYSCLNTFNGFLFDAILILGWLCYFSLKKEESGEIESQPIEQPVEETPSEEAPAEEATFDEPPAEE